jgi:hypothetical protein
LSDDVSDEASPDDRTMATRSTKTKILAKKQESQLEQGKGSNEGFFSAAFASLGEIIRFDPPE